MDPSPFYGKQHPTLKWGTRLSSDFMVSVDGFLVDAGMEDMMEIVLEPQIEGLIDLIEKDPILDAGEK